MQAGFFVCAKNGFSFFCRFFIFFFKTAFIKTAGYTRYDSKNREAGYTQKAV